MKRLAILTFALLIALEPAMLTAQSSVSYTPVTEQAAPESRAAQLADVPRQLERLGLQPLEQITPSNVKKLVPVWSFSTGVNEGHQAPPLVNNGVMFVTTPQQQVFALNAKTGDLIWKYKKDLPRICCSYIRPTAAWRCWTTGSTSRPSTRI
jgi:alcohol dehydrogenase (cytochrome c)